MGRTAIAVHACGFKGPDEICDIAKRRLELAAIIANERAINDVIISGGVPYRSESKMLLASLMAGFLEDKFPKLRFRIHLATACYNSSTDIQNILRIVKDQKITQLLVVSSYWHMWVLSPLYRYWAKKMRINFGVKYFSIGRQVDTVGERTLKSYRIYRKIIQTSLVYGFFPPIDFIINKIHSRRLRGYPATGCD